MIKLGPATLLKETPKQVISFKIYEFLKSDSHLPKIFVLFA